MPILKSLPISTMVANPRYRGVEIRGMEEGFRRREVGFRRVDVEFRGM